MTRTAGGPAARRPEVGDSGERLRPPLPIPTSAPTTLAERLRSERRRCFLGRAAELEFFRKLLQDPACSVLFLSGEVGVGKTALMRQLELVARSQDHVSILVDASVLSRSSEQHGEFAQKLAEGRAVLLVDGFEQLDQATTDWFLGEFVPSLSSDLLLVLASRARPPATLALDPAWARLMRRVDLAPLDEVDSSRLLELLGAAPSGFVAIQGMAAGYPLALAVAAECARNATESVARVGALHEVQHVLERLLCPKDLSAQQQFALDVCSVARITTAELLDHLRVTLKHPEDGEGKSAFDWLAQQSYVDSTPIGLVPHTLVRVAAHARFRRERPRLYRLMHQAIREFWVTEMETGSNGQVDYLNLLFLDREIPFIPQWVPMVVRAAPLPLRWATASDHAALLDFIRQQEGSTSAELAHRCLRADVGRFEVAGGGRLDRLSHSLRLLPGEVGHLGGDDPTYAIVRQSLTERPLDRDGEILIFRWWMDRERGQTPSTELLPILARQTQSTLRSKSAVRSFCVYRNPDEWKGIYDSTRLPWQASGRFNLDGRDFAVLEFDWSRRSLRDVLLSSWDQAERRFLPMGGSDRDPELSLGGRPAALDELRINVRDRVTQLGRMFKLTPREAEILEQLCLGEAPEAIGRRLAIRPRTVKFHQENLLRKTGVASRAELFRKLL